MAWGKLFGATSYVWLCAAPCLLVYGIAAGVSEPPLVVLKNAVLFAGLGLLCQATALLTSLLQLRPRDNLPNITGLQIYGLLPLVPAYFISRMSSEISRWWYGLEMTGRDFLLLNVLIFGAWAVFGVYRKMREELQLTNRPWAWVMFLAFLVFYLIGLAYEMPAPVLGLLMPTAVIFLFAYILALGEPKDIIGFRHVLHTARTGAWGAFFEDLPLWALTYVVAALAVVVSVCVILTGGPDAYSLRISSDRISSDTRMVSVFVAALLFLTRDIGLMLFLNLSRNPRRAGLATLLYWVTLYGFLPGVFLAFRVRGVQPFFYPVGDENWALAVLPTLAQAAAVAALVTWRWRWRTGRRANRPPVTRPRRRPE